jgi:hypothetical protein
VTCGVGGWFKFASPCLEGKVGCGLVGGQMQSRKSVVGTGAEWATGGNGLEAWTGQHVFQSSQHLVQSGKLGRVRA